MKHKTLNENGWVHWLAPLLVIVIVSIVGIRLLNDSHAANTNLSISDVKLGTATFISNPNRSSIAKPALESQRAQAQTTQGILPPQNPSQSLPPSPDFSDDCPWDQNRKRNISN